jgi:PPOX class probable F420-dependent enzyme
VSSQSPQDPLQQAKTFLGTHHRAVLVTRRRDGGVQTSPVTAGIDDAGLIIISTTETSAKARNLSRDPRAALCVVTDDWFGPWLHLEGTADLVRGADAIEPLVDYYRRISGEHPDWADYRRAMAEQRRVLVRITLERAVAPHG